jgi:anti-sigma factor RsiW
MMSKRDPILETDLTAYVDDQLDVGRRIEVEAYLSGHPAVAAQVMADLRVRDELRLALATPQTAPLAATQDVARRLERSLRNRRFRDHIQRAAVLALFIGAGWAGHAYLGPFGATEVIASEHPPVYVSEALAAHETTLIRAAMPSQLKSASYDPTDIRAATGITLPAFPEGWTVTDAEIFPSANGPSVEMVLAPATGGALTLFAVRPGAFAVEEVQLLHGENAQAAYWQIGEVAYALVSKERSAETLGDTARTLARTLY